MAIVESPIIKMVIGRLVSALVSDNISTTAARHSHQELVGFRCRKVGEELLAKGLEQRDDAVATTIVGGKESENIDHCHGVPTQSTTPYVWSLTCLATGYKLPSKDKAIMISSGETKSKVALLDAAAELVKAGYTIYASAGTARFLNDNNVKATAVYWPDEQPASCWHSVDRPRSTAAPNST